MDEADAKRADRFDTGDPAVLAPGVLGGDIPVPVAPSSSGRRKIQFTETKFKSIGKLRSPTIKKCGIGLMRLSSQSSGDSESFS